MHSPRFQSHPLNSSQSGMPVFFLPPHGAAGLEYHGFRHFFEAVQAPLLGFDAVYLPQDRLDDWVDALFHEVVRVWAGPGCRLLGWGHGATLAVLVGEKLRQAQIPAHLLLFDPVPPTGYSLWDRLKISVRYRLVGLPSIAIELMRWVRGLCTRQHMWEFLAAHLAYGYWLPARLQAQQGTRLQLTPEQIYAARSAFRSGTARFVPRPFELEAHLLLSSNRRQRHHQWRPYLTGSLELCALQRTCHDFSPQALSEISYWLNRLPQ